MRAVVCERYGPPEAQRIADVPKPELGDADLLVRVHASTVTASGGFMRRGEPVFARLFTGLLKPSIQIQGTDLAGAVESVGKDVTRFKPGDEIIAATDTSFGAHAEYAVVPEHGTVALKPANIGFGEAAAICEGGLAALPFLRDKAKVERGQRVLIIGASGAVGSFAVQLAKHFGAHVTGVCSGANVELVQSLGADEVIDYTHDDFIQAEKLYDCIFDTVGATSFMKCERCLAPTGVYLAAVFSIWNLVDMLLTSRIGKQKAIFAATGLRSAEEKAKDLEYLAELVEAGAIAPVIDRTYPMDQIVEASIYVDAGHKKGNVVLAIVSE